MALGAEAADARRLVVNAGLRLVAAGIALGMPVSLLLGRVIETQLVGVTTYRSAHTCHDDTAADDDRRPRVLDSCSESSAGRSNGGAARRIAGRRQLSARRPARG